MPPPPEQQAKRNLRIVMERHGGATWDTLAERHNLSARRCRAIYRSWMEQGGPIAPDDPVEVIDGLLRGLNTDEWELTEAVDQAWEDNNLAAVIGGTRARADTRMRAIEL